MRVVILVNEEQKEEILMKNIKKDVEIVFAKEFSTSGIYNQYDAIFFLDNEIRDERIEKISEIPVFINSVIETLKEKQLPANFNRINGWRGFLKRETWEVASVNVSSASAIFEELGWDMIFVKDEPGLVAARVISMLINEAFFCLEAQISSFEEIDKAMKLGTNYPNGPFEWAEKIGLKNIYLLLQKLSLTDKCYLPAPSLIKKYFEITSSL
ncbi:MAG: 3-hydroxyacyl-CoA dehydrogenase family protein [Ginsengibacter sp.]